MNTTESYGLGIVIVDYFKGKSVVKLVEQIIRQELGLPVEIYIIDNSMDEGNHKILKSINGVNLIRSGCNLGYTKACNLGASQLKSRYVLFINPDIEIRDPLVLDRLLFELKCDPSRGIVGPRQINPNGVVEKTARSYPTLLGILSKRVAFLRVLFKRSYSYYMASYDLNKSQFVDWLQSSFIVMELKDFRSMGGFDERYFLFMADVDISKKLGRIHKKTYYCSDVIVYPDGKRASAGGLKAVFSSKVLRIHLVDYFRYLLASVRSK